MAFKIPDSLAGSGGLSVDGDVQIDAFDNTSRWIGVYVRKNSTGTVVRQPRLNLIEGSNVTITVSEDTVDGEVDITIASSGGGGGGPTYTAGDGIDIDGSDIISVVVGDLVGAGIEDDGSNNFRISAAAAGAGLTGGGGSALAVGAGTGITVNANDVQISPIAAESFFINGTGSSAVPTAIAGSTVAGAGLTYSSGGILAVGNGAGITINANDVQLSTIADDTFMANVTGSPAVATGKSFSSLAGLNLSYDATNHELDWDGVDIRKNSTGSTFTRPRINFIEGSNITLTVADDSGDGEVDVTVAAASATFPTAASLLRIVEDFTDIGLTTSTLGTTAIVVPCGSTNWTAISSTSTGAIASAAGTSGHPGKITVTTSASSGDLCRLFHAQPGWQAGSRPNIIHYGDISTVTFIAQPSTLTSIGFGLFMADTITLDNAVGWLFDTNTDGNLHTITRASSVETNHSGTAVSTESKYEMIFTSGQVEFKLDGATFGTVHTTDLPTSSVLTPYIRVQSRTGLLRSITIDLFSLVSNSLSR